MPQLSTSSTANIPNTDLYLLYNMQKNAARPFFGVRRAVLFGGMDQFSVFSAFFKSNRTSPMMIEQRQNTSVSTPKIDPANAS